MRILDRLRSTDSKTTKKQTYRYALEARNLVTYGRNGERVLKGVSLQVEPQELVVISSSDAKDRNSLVRLLKSEIHPKAGRLFSLGTSYRLKDVSVVDFANDTPKLEELANSFDNRKKRYKPNPGLTASNFYEALTSRGHQKLVKSTDDITPPLSRIELRRLHLYNCYSAQNKVWILIEPYVGLDNTERDMLTKSILSATKNVAVVLISNEVKIARYANQVLTLDQGKLTPLSGTTDYNRSNKIMYGLGHSVPNNDAELQIHQLRQDLESNIRDQLVLRKQVSHNDDYSTWLAWHSQRVEPVIARLAESDAGRNSIAEERARLTIAKSVNTARVFPSNNADISVLEFCGADTLSDVMAANEPLNLAQIYSIGADVAYALALFHRKGLVHGKIDTDSVSRRENLWVLNSAMKPDADTTNRNLDVCNLGDILKQLLARYLRSGNPLRGETAQFAELIKQMQSLDPTVSPTAEKVSNYCYELLNTPPKIKVASVNQWTN